MVKYRRTFSFQAMTLRNQLSIPSVTRVVFTAADGKVGILAGRSPLIAKIGIGPLVVMDSEGKEHEFFVAGGFARVHEEATTVLADIFEPMDKIDPRQALDEIDRIKARPARTPEEQTAKSFAVEAARARFNLVQKYRRRKAQTPTEPKA